METMRDLYILYNFNTLKYNSFSEYLSKNLTKLQLDKLLLTLKKNCCIKPINNCTCCYYINSLLDS